MDYYSPLRHSSSLQDAYGGLISPQIVKDFEDFADLLFSQFDDRVKNWITINEPWCISYLGYVLGVFALGRCSESLMGTGRCLGGDSATEPYIVTHNQLLSHAAWLVVTPSLWCLCTGENKDGMSIGEKGSTHSRYNAYPKGLRLMLRHLKLQYNDPLIYVTENGLDEDRNDTIPISEALKDYKRKNYFFDHLCCLREAIEENGVNVKGYFAWSLTDNYEWASGYLVRFGVNYVDFGDKSLTRYPKLSAQWLGTIFAKPQAGGVSDH